MKYKQSVQYAALAATLAAVPLAAFANVKVPAIEAAASAASSAQVDMMAPVDAPAPSASSPAPGSNMPNEAMSAPLTMPPSIDPVSPDRVRLDAKEQRGVHLSRRWRYRQEMPEPGSDGYIRYLFGAALPTVVCAPLKVCDLTLQPGEVVLDKHIGDLVRWVVDPAVSGMGANQTTHLIIKPVDAGLETSLNIATNRRTYAVKLVSTRTEWMPLVGFTYPDDTDAKWAAYRQNVAFNATGYAETGGNPENLEFMCISPASGGPGWLPIRAYTDGEKTYIQFPRAIQYQTAPALVALGSDGTWFTSPTVQMVNYRAIGDRYVVDAVLDKAALISGVGGDQQRVTIARGKVCR